MFTGLTGATAGVATISSGASCSLHLSVQSVLGTGSDEELTITVVDPTGLWILTKLDCRH